MEHELEKIKTPVLEKLGVSGVYRLKVAKRVKSRKQTYLRSGMIQDIVGKCTIQSHHTGKMSSVIGPSFNH